MSPPAMGRDEARELAEAIIGARLVSFDVTAEPPEPQDGDGVEVWADRLAWLVLGATAEVRP